MDARHDGNGPQTTAFGHVVLSPRWQAQIEQFRSAHETKVLTILISDLEGSTRLQSELGNVRTAQLVQAHRTIFRDALRGLDGQEIETAGDSFLVVFAAPSEGVKFALRMMAAMRKAREDQPQLPLVRVGIHQGQIVVERHEAGPKPIEIYGLQVSTAARITDLACGGQILCSRAVFDDARAILRADDLGGLGPIAWRNHGPYRFKGVADSYDVCEAGEEGLAPLAPPAAGTKSWPAGQGEEELGWRPAAGVTVPGTNWVLEERLGKEAADKGGRQAYAGAFGEVWVARNSSDRSREVFKFCFKRDRVPALKREARLLKQLRKYRHPNLVEVYDVTEGDRPPYYLEMEYVEGPPLEAWLAARPPLRERLEVIAQIADALDTVHAAGIYHRDIKPSNILLTHRQDGRLQAKLTDFGLGAAEDKELLRSIYASRPEGVAGTWDYIAPELRKGRKASPQSDLYSLGVTLLQVAAGNLQQTLGDWEDHVQSEVLRGDIRRCVATDPALRWPNAGDLARALRSHDDRLERRRLEREREERRRRARRRWKIAAAAAVLAAAAAGSAYWWQMPGTLDLSIQPPGATLEVAGRTMKSDGWPIRLGLHAGAYEAAVSAEEYFPETHRVEVERGRTQQLKIALRHFQGALDAACEPDGSQIVVNGVPYGSTISNLTLDTGPYRLLTWKVGHFEDQRTVRIRKDQHTKERIWLDRGMMWLYPSPAIQSGMVLVADVDGDGMPDIAQNELEAVTVLSSGTGEVLARLPAPASGTRSFQEIDLGGDVGRVIACGKEVPGFGNPTGGLEVLVIRCAAPTEFLWQWRGPKADWRTPDGAGLCAVGDLDGDGVADLAVPCHDGSAYLLSGKTGEKLKELRFSDHPVEFPPGLYLLGGKGSPSLLFVARKPIASDAPGQSAWAHIVGCVRLTDGASLWQKDFGQVKGAFVQDLDGDGVREGLVWKDSTWQVIDGLTGEPRWHGALPQGRHFESCPLLADLGGAGALALLHIPANPADPMLALRLSDAAVLWQGPSQVRPQQPPGRDGLAFRAPRGELLVTTSSELMALDPQTGRTAWQTDGAPEGLLRGDWDGDGQDEIFATIPGRGLVCLDAAGQTRWALRLNIQVRPDLLVPDTKGDGLPKILIHRHAGLYAMVRGPRARWAQDATGPLQAAPLVVYGEGGGKPVVVQLGPWSNEESLRGFDAATGAVCWSARYWLPPNRAPALADWDGDGRCEIVAIGRTLDTSQYKLLVLRAADGTVVHGAPLEDIGATYSTPAVADFDGDGTLDVALHRWDKRDIVAFNGKTGALLWRCPTQLPNMGGVAAADLDGDGHPDVVAPSMDGHVYALRGRDGRPLWPPVSIGPGGSRAPPLLADVNGDGIPEILVAGRDGVLNIINGRTGEMIWKATCNFAGEGMGRPAVARAGDSTLIVAPLGAAGAVAFDFGNRKKVWQSPPGHPVIAGPVIADIDRDGVPEAVVATADGHVYVLDLATGEPLWHVQAGSETIEADPALVSCRGDGLPDILIADHAFRLTAFSSSGLLRNKHLQARETRRAKD